MPYLYINTIIVMAKYKMTIEQLVMVLQTEKAKYPIVLNMDKVSKKEVKELLELLKKRKG